MRGILSIRWEKHAKIRMQGLLMKKDRWHTTDGSIDSAFQVVLGPIDGRATAANIRLWIAHDNKHLEGPQVRSMSDKSRALILSRVFGR